MAISRDGRFVYASSRGENTLVVFSIDRRTGLLTLVQRVPGGGDDALELLDPLRRKVDVRREPGQQHR